MPLLQVTSEVSDSSPQKVIHEIEKDGDVFEIKMDFYTEETFDANKLVHLTIYTD